MSDEALRRSAQDLVRRGRIAEAEAALRAFLCDHPRHGDAQCELGVVLAMQKRIPDAIGVFETAIKVAPDSPAALAALGRLYGEAGRPQDALACLDRLLETQAHSPNAYLHHFWRGWTLSRLGREAEAVAAFEAAQKKRPDFAPAWEIGGIVNGRLRRPEAALRCFEHLCALLPGAAPAHSFRAVVLTELYRYGEAVAAFRAALRLDAKYVPAHVGIGGPLGALGRHEEALAAYETALKIDPNNAQAELGRGDALQILGRIDEAAASYRRVIALAPRMPSAYRHLFQVAPVTDGDDPALKALEAMAADETGLSEAEGAELHLALSKAYRGLDRFGPAFDHLERGNRRKRRLIVYDEAAALAGLRAASEKLTPEIMQAMKGQGDPSDLPVLVFGMPRSGTSLVEQILASHSCVFGAGESDAFRRLAWGRFGRRLESLEQKLSGEELKGLGVDYVAALRAMAPNATRIVDKTLNNADYAGLVHLAVPHARLVHVVRDAMDTCFSCYSQLFLGDAPFALDLGELGRYQKTFTAVMAHWRAVLPQEAILEIRYEALVEDFEAQARRLIAFCGLEWEDACLRFYETERAVRTASAVQVRRPLYKDAVGRWKSYAERLGPLREALGV